MRRIIPAAELVIPLCEQGEKLTVIDYFEEENLLDGNMVIMKGSRNLERIKMAATGRESYAVYNLGILCVEALHFLCFLELHGKQREKHMELNLVEIGKRIKMIRCKKRLSQIAFATELHVSREQISRWENGSRIPTLDILCQLSVVGKVSMDYLITGQEKDCPEKKMISILLGDLLEMERRIDHVIELVTEFGIM